MAQVEDAAISERSLLWLVAVWSAAAVILLHWFWVLYRSYCWKYRLPGPSIPLPFFLGHVVHIFLCVEIDFSRLHVGMYKMLLALDYSKIGRLWLGPREIVAITDPETFRRMLGSKYKIFDRSDVEFDIQFVRGGLITARNGVKWRSDRRMLAHHFDFDSLANHTRIVLDRARAAVSAIEDCLQAKSASASPLVDLKHFKSLESRQPLDDADPPMLAAFEKCLNTANTRFYMFWFPYWRIPGISYIIPGIREYNRCERRILDAIGAQIEVTDRNLRATDGGSHASEDPHARECTKGAHASTLEYILRKRLTGEIDMDDSEIKRQLVTFLFAGHDTTANMMCFLFLYLARNPDWQERVLAEVREHVPVAVLRSSVENDLRPNSEQSDDDDDDMPTNESILHCLSKLQLLEACLLETLRLKPSAPLRSRQTVSDVQVCGTTLPRGTLIGWSPYALHRHPGLWPEPTRWNPNRFLDTGSSAKAKNAAVGGTKRRRHHPFSFLPFGAGPRRCVGERLALVEAKIAAAVLLSRFSFADVSPNGLDLEEDAMGLTMYPRHGMPLAVSRRSSE